MDWSFKKVIFVLAIFALPIALTGCWFNSDNGTMGAIDPPPASEQGDDDQAMAEPPRSGESKESSTAQVYYLSDTGYVVPHAIVLSQTNKEQAIKEMVSSMVKETSKTLPQGYTALLPKGTVLLNVKVADKVAQLNFSPEFLTYDIKDESRILDALTWSLTGLPEVTRVKLAVNGRMLEVMPKDKTPVSNLTRNRGINLEVTKGVDPTHSMPVVLYFLGQTSDNKTYYIPVTRLVHRESNIAQAALSELIRGPELYSKLINPIDGNTVVNNVKVNGELATADFSEQLLQYGNQRQISQSALDAITLSLTENTGAKKVQVSVNGNSQIAVFGKSSTPMSKPVMRPQSIN